MIPKPNIVPPGGFHYVEPGLRLEGYSYQNLAEMLLKYRLENKRPVGDPLAEVMHYTCSRHPHFCAPADVPQVVSRVKPQALTTRVSEWLASLYRSIASVEKQFVQQGEADKRAAICAQCPKNVEWKNGCGSCVDAAKKLAYTLRGGRRADYENKLLGCEVSGQENATAVWLKAPPPMSPEEHAKLPVNCWRKK